MKISESAKREPGQIVVVEELPDNIYSIRFILESLGFKVASVSVQTDYLDEIQIFAPDLIIVDMLISDRGGLEVIRRLKESALKQTPSMAITAEAVAIEEKELLRSGFDDVLVKPYNVDQLREKLRKYVA